MSNKYDISIKDGDKIYVYNNMSLEGLEEVLELHKDYEQLNAIKKEENANGEEKQD